MSLLSAGLWFLGGAFTFSFVARVIRYYHLIDFTHDINIRVLKLFRDFEGHMDEEWKEKAIKRVIETYPEHWHHIVKFSNWSEAMEWIQQHEREELK